MNRERLFSVSFVLLATLTAAGAEHEHLQAKNANFDKRHTDASNPLTLEGTRAVAADRLRARMQGVQIDLDNVVASPRFIYNRLGFLSAPASAREITHPRVAGSRPDIEDEDPHRPIKQFLDENAELFGHDSGILTGARKTRDYLTEHNGMRTAVWQQELDGIPVFEAVLYGHIAKNGELVSLYSQFVPEPAKAADAGVPYRATAQLSAPISPQKAVANAATNIFESLSTEEVAVVDPVPAGIDRKQRFTAPPIQGEATANLVWLPMDRN
ncbi:MAG TPA: hypothetical protein VJW76_06960, partial [Verrucomicrobiae bacterium]|nr:hypothetical protein [Verrucomicrobiae bacterium]